MKEANYGPELLKLAVNCQQMAQVVDQQQRIINALLLHWPRHVHRLRSVGREYVSLTPTPEVLMAKAKGSVAEQVQNHIPGTGPKKIPKVHDAAVKMLDAIRKTKQMKAKEDETREDVRAAMEEEGIEEYEYGGLSVKIDLKRTPKAKMAKKQPDEPKE